MAEERFPYSEMRTLNRDRRFAGFWYCYTCEHYVCNLVGIMGDHSKHDIVKIPDWKRKPNAEK